MNRMLTINPKSLTQVGQPSKIQIRLTPVLLSCYAIHWHSNNHVATNAALARSFFTQVTTCVIPAFVLHKTLRCPVSSIVLIFFVLLCWWSWYRLSQNLFTEANMYFAKVLIWSSPSQHLEGASGICCCHVVDSELSNLGTTSETLKCDWDLPGFRFIDNE